MRNIKVYLAGGMKGDWQDMVIRACETLDVEFFDPRSHGIKDEAGYTDWDLTKVSDSDMVFAFMGKDNPSGFGMNLEIGYATALGIRVMFVEEAGDDRSRYYGMARACSTPIMGFVEGVMELKKWLKQ